MPKRLACFVVTMCLFAQGAFSQDTQLVSEPAWAYVDNVWTFADTGDHLYAGTSNGVFRTDPDATSPWVHLGPAHQRIYDLALDGEGTLFATTRRAVFRSADGGTTWTDVTADAFDHLLLYDVHTAANAGVLLVATERGVFRSDDRGDTWTTTRVEGGSWAEWAEANRRDGLTFSLASMPNGRLWAGGEGYVFASDDDGATWAAVPLEDRNNDGVADGADRILAVHTEAPGTLYALSSRSAFVSTDEGATWSEYYFPYRRPDNTSQAISSLAVTLTHQLAGTIDTGTRSGPPTTDWTGAYYSVDQGQSWQAATTAIGSVYALHAIGERAFAGGPNGAVHTSTDGGVTWTAMPIPEPSEAWPTYSTNGTWENVSGDALTGKKVTALAAHEDGRLYAGTLRNGLFISSDNGLTWQPPEATLHPNIFALMMHPAGGVLVGAYDGLYHSADGTGGWTVDAFDGVTVKGLARDANGLMLAAYQPRFGDPSVAPPSVDGSAFEWRYDQTHYVAAGQAGTAWLTANAPVIVDARGDAWTVIGGDLYRSSDDGGSRREVLVGTADVTALALHEGMLLAGTDAGDVLVTTDRGATWSPLGDPLPARLLTLLATETGHLYAGTQGNGLFRLTFAFEGTDASSPQPPARFALDATYPNPARTAVGIPFTLDDPGFVIITIHDVLGREVATLTAQPWTSGHHRVFWDASRHPSGTYFARLVSEGGAATRPIVVVR